ncbi:MAG: phage head closure protein [Christensenellaceae bacterium]
MKIAEMNTRATFQARQILKDNVGNETEAYTDAFTLWAKKLPLYASEVLAAGATSANLSCKLRLRKCSGIKADMRVRLCDITYLIESISDIDSKNMYMEVVLKHEYR